MQSDRFTGSEGLQILYLIQGKGTQTSGTRASGSKLQAPGLIVDTGSYWPKSWHEDPNGPSFRQREGSNYSHILVGKFRVQYVSSTGSYGRKLWVEASGTTVFKFRTRA